MKVKKKKENVYCYNGKKLDKSLSKFGCKIFIHSFLLVEPGKRENG